MSAIVADTGLIATVKTIHVFGGLYIWEWVTSLQYEWDVIIGKRKAAYWSFAVYSTTRLLALAVVILMFIGFDNPHRIDCEVWFRSTLIASYASVACCALLISLRAVALWGRSMPILVFAATAWIGDVAICAWNVTKANTGWSVEAGACGIAHTEDFRIGLAVNFSANVLLLSAMIGGVWRKKNSTELWHVLFIQGVAWIVFAMMSEIPSVVLSWVNLSDGWNLLFQTPHVILFVIVCTRMHRDLSQYISGPVSDRPAYLQPWPMANRPDPGIPMHVAVHRTVHVTVDDELRPNSSRGRVPTRDFGQVTSLSPDDIKDMALVM